MAKAIKVSNDIFDFRRKFYKSFLIKFKMTLPKKEDFATLPADTQKTKN